MHEHAGVFNFWRACSRYLLLMRFDTLLLFLLHTQLHISLKNRGEGENCIDTGMLSIIFRVYKFWLLVAAMKMTEAR